MRELVNGVAQGQPEAFHHLVLILHDAASLKRLSYPLILVHIWGEAMHSTRSFYTALLSVVFSP